MQQSKSLQQLLGIFECTLNRPLHDLTSALVVHNAGEGHRLLELCCSPLLSFPAGTMLVLLLEETC